MNEDENFFVPTIILNFAIILTTFYLLFLYIKTNAFYNYSCANILNLSLMLSVDNIVRLLLIPNSWNNNQILQYFQAFILVSLDKFILIVLTLQAFIIYIVLMKVDFYFNHEKAIFLTTFLGNLFISFLIGGLYLLFGIVKYGTYYYAKRNNVKTILDSIFNSIFLFLDTFFCLVIIFNMIIRKRKKKKRESLIYNDSGHRLIKIILMFILNSSFFIESFLILFDKLPVSDDLIDFIYLITCFIINLTYAINKKVLIESKRLFCKKLCNEKKHKKINTFESSRYYNSSSEEGTFE